MWKWVQNLLLKKALKKGASTSGIEKLADETLANAIKDLQTTSKTAQKLFQAKILQAQSKKTMEDMQLLDDDDDSDDEIEDGELGIMDLIKLFENSKRNQGVSQNSIDPYAEPTTAQQPARATELLELVKTLTPEQKKLIKQKYGIAL